MRELLGLGLRDRFGHQTESRARNNRTLWVLTCVCTHVCESGMRETNLDEQQSPIHVKTEEAMSYGSPGEETYVYTRARVGVLMSACVCMHAWVHIHAPMAEVEDRRKPSALPNV